MTRLAAVLAAAIRDADHGSWGEAGGHWSLYPPAAERVVVAILEPVREAIEAALDVCAVCGMWPGWGDHDDNPGFRMAVGGSYHPYQPLVAP